MYFSEINCYKNRPRGLYISNQCGAAINADVSGAINILKNICRGVNKCLQEQWLRHSPRFTGLS